jgi:carboxylesterase type B
VETLRSITAFGVSAGSASIYYHTLSGDPLFDRAILMSGGAPTLGPLPHGFHETAWEKLCTKLGLGGESHTPNQRLAILRAMKPEEVS